MSSAEETLTELQAWLKQRWRETNDKRRHALSAGEDLTALTSKYERDAFRETLDLLETKRSGNG